MLREEQDGERMGKKKKERAELKQKSFPRLDPRGLKEADKDISRRSIKRQQAKKKALSPHRGQARPLVSGVGTSLSEQENGEI